MLPQRVRQLRPRHESLDSAVASYLSADYDECLVAVHGDPTPPAIVLHARSLIRLKQEREAIDALDNALNLAVGRDRLAEMLTLKGTAQICVGEFAEAERTLVEARVSAYLSGSSSIEAESEYATAILHWSLGDFDEVERACNRILSLRTEPEAWLSASSMKHYAGSLSEVKAKALDLLGARAAVRENFDEQASLIMMAFEQLVPGRRYDSFFESRLLLNLAVIARDLDFPESFEFVSRRLQTFSFGPYNKLAEFHIRRSLGWCSAGRGNHLGAFREFRESADAAPSIPWKIIAVLDRALLARELHEHHCAQEELDYAVRLYKQVDWQATRDEERSALFMLAQHLAPSDILEARKLLDCFNKIRRPFPVTSFANKDRRFFADISYATAQVLKGEGDRGGATRSLLDCYEVWTQIGYVSRAASAAADLAELTGNRHYFDVAMREAGRNPQSWFAGRLRSIGDLVQV